MYEGIAYHMKRLSKSRYTAFCQCPKNLWLKVYKPEDAKTLAAKYDFSGGQIENIARHYTIDSILHDVNEDKLAMLISHCDNERLDNSATKRIGF